jgi:hypothetical protein
MTSTRFTNGEYGGALLPTSADSSRSASHMKVDYSSSGSGDNATLEKTAVEPAGTQ